MKNETYFHLITRHSGAAAHRPESSLTDVHPTWVLAGIAIVLLACLPLLPGRAAAAVFDDFEAYPVDTNLHGQGGWAGWGGDANAAALVSSNFSFSPTRSVNIAGASDLVLAFHGTTNGQWSLSMMQYIPSTSTGTNYAILLNTYGPPYGIADLNSSVQIQNDLVTGQVVSELGGGVALPMVRDQWVEVRFEINLASNSVSEFYNGQHLSTHVWQGGTGLNEVQALGLFANNAGPVYYDDVKLSPSSLPPSITQQPQSLTVSVGQMAGFSVTASGTLPWSYQWYFNGSVLPGRTNSTLNIPEVQPWQAGAYFVAVTDQAGTVNSSNATLDVVSGEGCCTNKNWIELLETGPAPRLETAMAYDAVHDRTTLFGGSGNGSSLDDTWVLKTLNLNNHWTHLNPVSRPSARFGHTMAYDPARGVVVLYGGANSILLQDTWEFDGVNWANHTSAGPGARPSARREHAMAYDPVSGKVFLFGGFDGGLKNDSWEWDGTAWNEVNISGLKPPARQYHQLSFDVSSGKVTLFGGQGFAGSNLGDTWLWDGLTKTWAQVVPTTSPGGRYGYAMTAGGLCQRPVVYGGLDASGYLSETWEFNWNGGAATWNLLTPAITLGPRAFSPMAYDSFRRRVIFYGGSAGGNRKGDTWEWTGDCNTNGVCDYADIMKQTSLDCNGNGIPDECELDCNHNGVPDDCECFPSQLKSVQGTGGSIPPPPPGTAWTRKIWVNRAWFRKVGDSLSKGEVDLTWINEPANTSPIDLSLYPEINKAHGPNLKVKKTLNSHQYCEDDYCNAGHAHKKKTYKWQDGFASGGRPIYLDYGTDWIPKVDVYTSLSFIERDNNKKDRNIGQFDWVGVPLQQYLSCCVKLDLSGDPNYTSITWPQGSQFSTLKSKNAELQLLYYVSDAGPGYRGQEISGAAGNVLAKEDDLIRYAFAQRNGSPEFWFKAYVPPTANLLTPFGNYTDTRIFHFCIDIDNDLTTGCPFPPYCGAEYDARVTLKDIPNPKGPGTVVGFESKIYTWCGGAWLDTGRTPNRTEPVYNGVHIVVPGDAIGTCVLGRDIVSWIALEHNGGITDTVPGDGNPCDLRLNIPLVPDTDCPQVQGLIPEAAGDGSLNALVVDFDEPMDPIGSGDVSLSLFGTTPVAINLQLDSLGKTLRVTPAGVAVFPPGELTLTISDQVTDVSGNQLEGVPGKGCGTPYVAEICSPERRLRTVTSGGVLTDHYAPNDLIFVTGEGFPAIMPVSVYVVPSDSIDAAGDPLIDFTDNGRETVITTAGGNLPVTNLGHATAGGEYWIVVDQNQNDQYDPGIDRVFDPCSNGFTVDPLCDEGIEDLIAYWPLDEAVSGGASAELLGALHAVHFGGPVPVAGISHNALQFNGTASMSAVDNADLNFDADDFSIELWLKSTDTDPYAPVLEKRSAGSSWLGYALYLEAGHLAFALGGDPGNSNPFEMGVYGGSAVGPLVANGAWRHVAVTAKRSTLPVGLKLYVDGNLVFSTTTVVLASTENFADLLFARNRLSDPALHYTGSMDEVALYDRALEQSEIQYLATHGSTGKCADPCPPFFGEQPLSTQTMTGQATSFSINAYGRAPLVYQWRKDQVNLVDDAHISGAQTALLAINPTLAADAGSYDVVVTAGANECGSITSDRALLTVLSDCLPARIMSASSAGGTFTMTFSSQVGFSYRVEYKNTLNDASWTALDANIIAKGVTTTATDAIETGRPRFYRVLCIP